MKPEVQPKRLKTPPAEVVPEEPPFLSAEGFRRNRSLLLGIGAALVVVLVGIAGVGIRSYVVASANTKGWQTYATTRANLSFAAAPPTNEPKGPEDSVRDIEAALPSIRDTSAEPWMALAAQAKLSFPKLTETTLPSSKRPSNSATNRSRSYGPCAADFQNHSRRVA